MKFIIIKSYSNSHVDRLVVNKLSTTGKRYIEVIRELKSKYNETDMSSKYLSRETLNAMSDTEKSVLYHTLGILLVTTEDFDPEAEIIITSEVASYQIRPKALYSTEDGKVYYNHKVSGTVQRVFLTEQEMLELEKYIKTVNDMHLLTQQ